VIVERLAALAAAPRLLVACDFDGTISELCSDPSKAVLDPACAEALWRLQSLESTMVAVISGRPLAWLSAVLADFHHVRCIGSHGAEDGEQPLPEITEAERTALRRVQARMHEWSLRIAGTIVEEKPRSVAFHYRQAPPAAREVIAVLADELRRGNPELVLRSGSLVCELAVPGPNKGIALSRLRMEMGATHTVFLGDDDTDEDAFAALTAGDLGVKVGQGETLATSRVATVADVARLLDALTHRRSSSRCRSFPLNAYSVLSDQRTCAVVSPVGTICWLCMPRLDSPAFFGDLIGGNAGGWFSIAPVSGGAVPSQAYEGESMILRTTWPTMIVRDFLDCSSGRAYQRAGRTDLVRSIAGSGRVRIEVAPRPDFGRTDLDIAAHQEGLEFCGLPEPCVLVAPDLPWVIERRENLPVATAEFDLEVFGGSVDLELRFGTGNRRPAATKVLQRRDQTARHWEGWVTSLRMPARNRAEVIRSALMLKALCHGPSGAIAAAATTSLPEEFGGVRNWDYRFCWPRDAAMAARSLMRLGNTGHAMKLADWLATVVDSMDDPSRLRPLFTVSGTEVGPEAEIATLCGYRESRPVRVNNAAAQQVQLDVFGPIVDMVAAMVELDVPITADHWRLVRAMVQAVESRWMEPDHGIWEIRGARRHHVHSKVMSWVAVDRALIVHESVVGSDNAAWRRLAESIRQDVLSNGFSSSRDSFVGAYGVDELDASVLAIGLTGMIPPDDVRWRRTVEAINLDLRENDGVYRYRHPDGLPGREGCFVIATCWLVQALASIGRVGEAEALLARVVEQCGPTGTLCEQWSPSTREALGNLPQAYSHLGLIDAVCALDRVAARFMHNAG